MKYPAIILYIFLIPYLGFSQQTISGEITHDGMQREYILYVPANYSGNFAVPLIFNFHGYGSNAYEQMLYGDFRSISDTAGFLVVHPQGTLYDGVTHWNVGGWTIGSTTDDVGFTQALLDSISSMYNIDPTRIYATGMSNGGFMSFLLSCQLSQKIAAIASVTGSMTPETFNNSNPQHPTAILQMHGTTDNVVPYYGTTWSKSIEDVLQYWNDYNNCNTIPEITALPDIDPTDGSTVEHFVYASGDNGVNVEHFKITGGGHAWPGSGLNYPGTNNDIHGSTEIWNFFSRYDIYGLINTTDIIQVSDADYYVSFYPNPSTSHITVKTNLLLPINYEIFSSTGIRMAKGMVNTNHHQIDLSPLSPNIYFLKIRDKTYKVVKSQ